MKSTPLPPSHPLKSKALDRIRTYHTDLTAIRRDLHAHPELGLEVPRTAEIVAALLESWGIEAHRRVGGHGVVGVLRQGTDGGNGQGSIGLRADMDALPIEEATGVAYSSRRRGSMHACGHDGHTAILLGAARYLAETRDFSGTVNFIFQPGEEGAGGALAMLADGLFTRFPCDQIYGLHNRPGSPVGQFAITPGPAMAGGAFFDITITGKGAHGARPEESIDPVYAACQIGTALQSVVARNLKPFDMAVLSVTQIHAGDAYNVIPQTAVMRGTARAMTRATLDKIETSLRRVVAGVAVAMGAEATVEYRVIFAPLINDAARAQCIADAAADVVGDANVDRRKPPASGSEDFSFMMEQVPGAYINLGNGANSAPVHNSLYNFDDDAIPFGAAMFARVVERELRRDAG
jgi:amidohydrolase